MRKKLIIYAAGIIEGDKGGWSFAYFRNTEFLEMHIGYGKSSSAIGNKKIEIQAYIMALENIKFDNDIEMVEIRIGYSSIVNEMNQLASYYYLDAERIAKSTARLQIQDETLLLRLAQLIIHSKYRVRFKKVDFKDDYYKVVRKQAESVIHDNILEEKNFYLKNATSKQISVLPKYSKISISNVKEEFDVQKEFIPWHQNPMYNNQVIELDINKIKLNDELHLKTNKLHLNGILYIANNTKQIKTPIIVRQLDKESYALVMGLKSYCVTRILGMKTIKAYITELSRDDFIKSLGISPGLENRLMQKKEGGKMHAKTKKD